MPPPDKGAVREREPADSPQPRWRLKENRVDLSRIPTDGLVDEAERDWHVEDEPADEEQREQGWASTCQLSPGQQCAAPAIRLEAARGRERESTNI